MSDKHTSLRKNQMIMRGLLIICIVIGHGMVIRGDIAKSVAWISFIAVPGFFFLAGMNYKPRETMEQVKKVAITKFRQLMIPYFIILFVIESPFLVKNILDGDSVLSILKEMVLLIYGGEFLVGLTTAAWFVPVFYFTRVFSDLLHTVVKKNYVPYVMGFIYLLGMLHGYINIHYGLHILSPMCVLTTFVTIPYFYIGYRFRKNIKELHTHYRQVMVINLFIAVGLILTYVMTQPYIYDLRSIHYMNPIIDLFLPLSLFLILFAICDQLGKLQWVAKPIMWIGNHSIGIMYFHLSVNFLLRYIVPWDSLVNNMVVFTIVGVLGPIAISKIIKMIPKVRAIFIYI